MGETSLPDNVMPTMVCKYCGKARTKWKGQYHCLHCKSMKKYGIDAVCKKHKVIMRVEGPYKRWSTNKNDYVIFYRATCDQCETEIKNKGKRDDYEEKAALGLVTSTSDCTVSPISEYKKRVSKMPKKDRDLRRILLGKW